jgi:hypothetical protein
MKMESPRSSHLSDIVVHGHKGQSSALKLQGQSRKRGSHLWRFPEPVEPGHACGAPSPFGGGCEHMFWVTLAKP